MKLKNCVNLKFEVRKIYTIFCKKAKAMNSLDSRKIVDHKKGRTFCQEAITKSYGIQNFKNMCKINKSYGPEAKRP